MDMDSRTIAFLAVAAFMSLLLLCCIILSVLFYIRYRNTEVNKDDRDNKERQRIKKLKDKLMKQFKNELKKQTNKRQKQGKIAPVIRADDTETACSICLDSLLEGDTADTVLALLVKCGHVYHMDCVWPWLERDHSCPICRRDMELNMSDLKAVTIYHVFNNFDLPSIRESVSRADLHSRLAYDCLEVVSVNEDDMKTPRSSRVIPVLPADVTSDSLTPAGVTGGSQDGIPNPSVYNEPPVNNPSTQSAMLNEQEASIVNNGSQVAISESPENQPRPNVIFTIEGPNNEGDSNA